MFSAVRGVIVKVMFAAHRRGVFLGSKGQRPHSGKGIADIRSRKLDLRKQVNEGTHQVVDLVARGLDVGWIPLVGNLGGAHQHLFIPGDNEDRTFVHGFGVHRRVRSARESGQHDVRAADAFHHRMRGLDAGALAQPVCPRTSGIDDPGGFDTFFFPGQLVPQQDASHAPLADIHGEHLRVIARHRASLHRLYQPLRHQTLGEFALGILVAEHRPAPATVEQTLQLLLVPAARSSLKSAPAQTAI